MKLIALDLSDKDEELCEAIRWIVDPDSVHSKYLLLAIAKYNDFLIPLDGNDGTILAREDFENFIASCQDFYNSLTDEEIETVNEVRSVHCQEKLKRDQEYWRKLKARQEAGCVYLVRRAGEKLCKIGCTAAELKQRLYALKREYQAEDLDLLHSIKADKPYKAEKLLHQRFADKRKRGEWFDLTDKDILDIQSLERFEDGKFYADEN